MACGGGNSGPVRPPSEAIHSGNGANQRRGRDISLSGLFEMVLGIQQAAPECGDQLSVDRIGRRHPPAARAHGLLRRQRSADVRRDAREGAGPILHFPTVLGAVVPVYNIEGVSTQIKFTGPILADIFLGKIRKWNDPAHREDQLRRLAAVERHHGRAPVRRIRDDVRLGRLPVEDLARVEGQGRRQLLAELAGRRRRQRQRRRGGPRQAVARLARLRRAGVRAAEQDRVWRGAESSPASSSSQTSNRSRPPRRRHADDAERFPRVDYELARCGRVSHLVVHLDSSLRKSGEQERTRR